MEMNRLNGMRRMEQNLRYEGYESRADNVAELIAAVESLLDAQSDDAAPAPAVVQAEVSEAQVFAAARVLANRSAEACNVDKEDNWKVYGQDFIDDARAALIAAQGAK